MTAPRKSDLPPKWSLGRAAGLAPLLVAATLGCSGPGTNAVSVDVSVGYTRALALRNADGGSTLVLVEDRDPGHAPWSRPDGRRHTTHLVWVDRSGELAKVARERTLDGSVAWWVPWSDGQAFWLFTSAGACKDPMLRIDSGGGDVKCGERPRGMDTMPGSRPPGFLANGLDQTMAISRAAEPESEGSASREWFWLHRPNSDTATRGARVPPRWRDAIQRIFATDWGAVVHLWTHDVADHRGRQELGVLDRDGLHTCERPVAAAGNGQQVQARLFRGHRGAWLLVGWVDAKGRTPSLLLPLEGTTCPAETLSAPADPPRQAHRATR